MKKADLDKYPGAAEVWEISLIAERIGQPEIRRLARKAHRAMEKKDKAK